MSLEMSVDMSQFTKTLGEYMTHTPHELSEIVNKKMCFIVRGARERTPQADRGEIERTLYVTAYKLSKRKGQIKRGRAVVEGTVAAKIVNARRRAAGKKGLHGDAMAKAVQRMVGGRLRAIGTARRGWMWPLLVFARAAKESAPGSSGNGMRKIKAPGTAKAAEPGWNPTGEATYGVNVEANPKSPRHNAHIDPRVEKALADAFNAEEQSMREYIEKKISDELNKISG